MDIFKPNVSEDELKSYKRDIIYITKDKIKKGDWILGQRINDNDVYSKMTIKDKKFKNIPSSEHHKYPILVMVAKIDTAEDSNEIKEYIEDILLNIEDKFEVNTSVYVSKMVDDIRIKINTSNKIGKEILEECESIKNRTVLYLKSLGFNLLGKCSELENGILIKFTR